MKESYVTIDNLDEEQQNLANIIGFENYINLVSEYGGQNVYVPKLDNLAKLSRNLAICNEFTGYNYKALSKKYGLSEVTIRTITNSCRGGNSK